MPKLFLMISKEFILLLKSISKQRNGVNKEILYINWWPTEKRLWLNDFLVHHNLLVPGKRFQLPVQSVKKFKNPHSPKFRHHRHHTPPRTRLIWLLMQQHHHLSPPVSIHWMGLTAKKGSFFFPSFQSLTDSEFSLSFFLSVG